MSLRPSFRSLPCYQLTYKVPCTKIPTRPSSLQPAHLGSRTGHTAYPRLANHSISCSLKNLTIHSSFLNLTPSLKPPQRQVKGKACLDHDQDEAGGTAPEERDAPLLDPFREGRGLLVLSAKWGKRFWGNVKNIPRGWPNSYSKYRSKKFTMKKHRYTKRWRMRRFKVAAIGNTPFAKKVRVLATAKFSQHQDKDVDAISREQLSEAMDGGSTAGKPGTKSTRGRRKSKYM